MGIEKDKGYAWVVVAASSFLMFIGPSSYSSYGLLFMEVDLKTYRNWIINSMCSLWLFTGLLAGPMAAVSTHRKIALIGCFMATCGYLMASATLSNPVWLFLSFSILVGVGLGLAINVTFLVVAEHFEKYRGLAIGIGQISVSIGYMTTPFLYSIIEGTKDKLHIRALLTAVAFLSATFYLRPAKSRLLSSSQATNSSNSQRLHENMEQLSSGDSQEDIPLVEIKEDNTNNANSTLDIKPRRRSQYLIAISATLLPKIPEESENNSLNEATVESCPPSPSISASNINALDNQCNRQIQYPNLPESSSDVNGSSIPISVNPSTYQTSRKCQSIANSKINNNNGRKSNSSSVAKRVYKIRRARSANECARDTGIELVNDLPGSDSSTRGVSRFKFFKYCREVISKIDFKLFTNVRFLNMAWGSAFAVIAFPSFPVILCSYISLISPVADKEEEEIALLIIFSIDMVSRLFFSYISDFSFFNRRVGFFCGTFFGTLSITCVGFVTDMNIIYCLCAIYGMCMGILIVTESLMFIDIFGMEKLPSTYGIVNLFKCLCTLVITPLIGSPVSAFMYPTHPFSYTLNHNSTTCQNCDPLGLYQFEDNQAAIFRRQNMLCIVAAPGILCSILWIFEGMWVRTAKRSRGLQRSAFSENSENLRSQV